MTTHDFCKKFAEKFEDVAQILVEHVADNDELLPHLFLADVTRYILADGPSRRAIVEYLDKAFASEGYDVEELIAVSFVEYLVDQEEMEFAFEGVDASQLQTEWYRQRSR